MLVDDVTVNAAWNVAVSLAPAFAAGFAIQRFIEILDSIIDVGSWVGENWKRATLNSVSLLIGFVLAYSLEIRVVKVLSTQLFGTDTFYTRGIDFFVSALIISAGTEGLNSILKFLSYTKEVQSQEVEVKRALVETETETFTALRNERLSSFVPMAAFPTFILAKDLKHTLKIETKALAGDKFDEDNWEKTAYSDYTDIPDDPKDVVLKATQTVVDVYHRKFKPGVPQGLQALVSLATTPEEILPNMQNAVRSGSEPI